MNEKKIRQYIGAVIIFFIVLMYFNIVFGFILFFSVIFIIFLHIKILDYLIDTKNFTISEMSIYLSSKWYLKSIYYMFRIILVAEPNNPYDKNNTDYITQVQEFCIKTLHLNTDFTQSDIKKNWKKLARRYHPDIVRNCNCSEKEKEERIENFKTCSDCKEFLLNLLKEK